jgi:hypothetical protein
MLVLESTLLLLLLPDIFAGGGTDRHLLPLGGGGNALSKSDFFLEQMERRAFDIGWEGPSM